MKETVQYLAVSEKLIRRVLHYHSVSVFVRRAYVCHCMFTGANGAVFDFTVFVIRMSHALDHITAVSVHPFCPERLIIVQLCMCSTKKKGKNENQHDAVTIVRNSSARSKAFGSGSLSGKGRSGPGELDGGAWTSTPHNTDVVHSYQQRRRKEEKAVAEKS